MDSIVCPSCSHELNPGQADEPFNAYDRIYSHGYADAVRNDFAAGFFVGGFLGLIISLGVLYFAFSS